MSALLPKISNDSSQPPQYVVAVTQNLQMPCRIEVFIVGGLHAGVRLSWQNDRMECCCESTRHRANLYWITHHPEPAGITAFGCSFGPN
jgi:hypothetical protein